jgi:hypothetical protein
MFSFVLGTRIASAGSSLSVFPFGRKNVVETMFLIFLCIPNRKKCSGIFYLEKINLDVRYAKTLTIVYLETLDNS